MIVIDERFIGVAVIDLKRTDAWFRLELRDLFEAELTTGEQIVILDLHG